MFVKSAKKKNIQQAALVTMRDVAERAGVSQSTVSRVLNQSNSAIAISEETRQKVIQAVTELRYYPNMTARALRTQRTNMIAVLVADIANSFYHSIARAVQDYFVQHGYDVLIANSDHLYDNEKRFCQAMLRRPVDGIVMVPYHLSVDEIVEISERTGAAIAILGSHIEHNLIDSVWCNDSKATYDTIHWLAQVKGYQEIGYLRVPLHYISGARRYRAYLEAMRDLGLTPRPEWTQEGEYTIAGGQIAMQAMLNQPNPPRVVVASNDLMALGALSVAFDMNVRVPEDVAIVGFDDIPVASLVRPSLTTIAQPPVEIGTHLAEMVYRRIEGLETGLAHHIELPLRLIERQST